VNDADIIELYWQRDEKATDAAYTKYSRYCHAIALNIVGSAEDAEECVNDAFLGAWEAIPPARPELLNVFLGKITRNIALNRVRDRERLKRGGGTGVVAFDELGEVLPDEEPGPEEQAEAGEVTALLNRFLAGLPEEHRKIFVCRYWYGDSVGDIAKRFGYTEGKIKMQLMRLRKELQKLLEKEGTL